METAYICYSYTSNNPVRYTDPSGFFEEDQIMQYLGADSWDAVLAMFESGRFEGAWGWLEVLREAELGDNVEVWNHNQPYLAGTFSDEGGQLMFSSSINGTDVNWSANDSIGLAAYGGNPNVSYWVRNASRHAYVVNAKHYHLLFHQENVDWVDVGFGMASIQADAGLGVAAAGASHGNIPLALLGATWFVGGESAAMAGLAKSFGEARFGDGNPADLAVDLGTAAIGLIPQAGLPADLFGLGYDLLPGVYFGP